METAAFSLRGRPAAPAGESGLAGFPLEASVADRPDAGQGVASARPNPSGRAGEALREPELPEIQFSGSVAETVILANDLISVKLPPDVGRQLAAIAERRGSKRTLVAVEALSGPLHALAEAHRSGHFPELPKVVAGTVRSSIAFALPPGLAADLDYVLRTRRAVRAQVVTRLLVPAIRSLYAAEVGGRSE